MSFVPVCEQNDPSRQSNDVPHALAGAAQLPGARSSARASRRGAVRVNAAATPLELGYTMPGAALEFGAAPSFDILCDLCRVDARNRPIPPISPACPFPFFRRLITPWSAALR